MENHYYDDNGVYAGSAPAHPGTKPPRNAIREAPGEIDGHWPVLKSSRDGWDFVEDHRGEQGWLGGVPAVIETVGPLPEGWSAAPPEEAETSPAERRRLAYFVRADPHRDAANAYRLEADAWAVRGDAGRAADATAKYYRELALYLDAKEAVREEIPGAGEETEGTT